MGIFINIISESYQKTFYFYHVIDKNVKLNDEGILSAQYMVEHKMNELVNKYLDKYRDRIVHGWGLIPNKDPNELSINEIEDSIRKFRNDPDGLNRIYLFRYPPYKELGKNMAGILKNKKIYRVDLNNPELKKLIKKIHWGYNMSHTNNKELTESYYKNISEKDYFSKYDDNNPMAYSTLNHISISMKNGNIPSKFIEEII